MDDLFSRLLEGHSRRAEIIPPRTSASWAPLSSAQERMTFLEQLDPGTARWHLPGRLRISGELDVAALAAAFRDLQGRHEILRTRLPARGGHHYQHIEAEAEIALPVEDLRGLPAPARDARLAAIVAEEARPFDFARGPLWRVRLVHLEEREHVLLLTLHHVICDGWSMNILFQELDALYVARAGGRTPELPALLLQYADYASWQTATHDGERFAKQLSYWRAQLLDVTPVALPSDPSRPADSRGRGGRVRVRIPRALAESLRARCISEDVTLFMGLLTVFNELLRCYSGAEDIAVGVPVANRIQRQLRPLIGLFVNTVVVRTDVSGGPSFVELLRRTREAALGAFANQEVPFEQVVHAVTPARATTHTPLFNVMFAVHGVEVPPRLGDLVVEQSWSPPERARVDLSLALQPSGDGGLDGAIEYDTDLLDGELVERMARSYERLLSGAMADPLRRMAEVPFLDEAETTLVRGWNATERALDAAAVPAMIEAQVDRAPDAIAVVFEAESLTYRELDARANQLAHHLRAQGVSTDEPVAVLLERSPALVVALLAVWKAGAAYVPLDPRHPRDRLGSIVEDAGARIVVSDAALAELAPAGTTVIALDRDADSIRRWPASRPARRLALEQLAYVIYTSGSTGRPKGVGVEHRALANFIASMRRAPGMTAADTLLAVTTVSFDISGLELWLPLCVGARVVVASGDEALDPVLLAPRLDAIGATMLQATPAMWQMLLDAGWRGRAELVALCGGEALPPELARALGPKVRQLWNLYGPTETTIWSAGRVVDRNESPIVIGGPIDNTQLYVLDRWLGLAPSGVAGELYIGGAGLARGYLGRPDLTAERFVPDPFGPAGSRIYRTGDLVRRRRDGTLEFLGRTDHQVKIRGFRIELGEIERVLAAHASVTQSVVVARDGVGGPQLVAYVIGADGFDAAAVRAYLAEKLPQYMVPAALVTLEAFPRSTSGKVDRKALPAPDFSAAAAEYVAPTTPIEQAIAEIWKEVLGVPRAGLHDDFFALGGHSLVAMRVVSGLRVALGVEVPVRDVFAAPTLAALARATSARIESSGSTFAATLAEVLGEHRDGTKLTRAVVAQEYFWYLAKADPDPAAYAMQVIVHVEGPLDCEALQRSAEAVVARHSIFRTAFREIDGRLFQYVSSEVPRFELELRNVAPLPEDDWTAELDRSISELLPRVGLTSGHRICGRLTVLAPERHALILVLHHAVGDAASTAALRSEIFERYHEVRSNAEPQDRRTVQFIDYAEALERFAQTPTGRARRDWWRETLRDAHPLTLPVDLPRAEHDARRAAAPCGITPDRMHYPYFRRELPAAARDNVLRAAREGRTTPYAIYLSGLAWLLHQLTGNDDICIENTYSQRALHPDLERVQGSVTAWTITRIDTSGCETLLDLIPKTTQVVGAASEHGVISEYYELVPASIRRAIFNYVPVGGPAGAPATDLRVVPQARPFPLWKRPWELHLTMLDTEKSTYLVWTGIEELFRRETVGALLDRYVDLFEHHLE